MRHPSSQIAGLFFYLLKLKKKPSEYNSIANAYLQLRVHYHLKAKTELFTSRCFSILKNAFTHDCILLLVTSKVHKIPLYCWGKASLNGLDLPKLIYQVAEKN